MSGTSKALFSVLAYPTSADIEFVINTFVGAGGSCMWILHDKDTKKDGSKKDEHFHIAVGWSKRAPDWDKFCAIMDETGHGIGNHGALCPSKRRQPYDPEQARVKGSVDELREYFLHKDAKSRAAGKHEYSEDELHYTDKWDGESYQTYTQKRQNAKSIRDDARQEKVADCSELFDIIRQHEFTEYCQLVDFLQSQKPDLLGGLLCNAYAVKSYLDSYRLYTYHEQDEQCKRLTAQLKRQNAYIKQLEGTIEGLQQDYASMQQEYCSEVQQLVKLYEQATGETVPEYATIAEYGKEPTYRNQNAEIGRK